MDQFGGLCVSIDAGISCVTGKEVVEQPSIFVKLLFLRMIGIVSVHGTDIFDKRKLNHLLVRQTDQ